MQFVWRISLKSGKEVTLCIEDWAEKTPARELAPVILAFLRSAPSDFEKAEKEFRSALKKLRSGHN